MGSLIQDVRFALRMLAKKPGFAAVAIVTLALGIGANAAIFTVVNAVLLRPLPYDDPDRLVLVRGAPLFLGSSGSRGMPPVTEWFDWRQQAESFEYISAASGMSAAVNLTGAGDPERIEASEVTANFFETMGVRLARGRAFRPDEELAGKTSVAVISYGLWQRRFGGSDEAMGQTLWLNGRPFTVVGVAPHGLQH